MNPFSSLVPPNMDVECQVSYVYNLSGGVSSTDSICSSPWDYYKGFGFDLVLIGVVAGLVLYAIQYHFIHNYKVK